MSGQSPLDLIGGGLLFFVIGALTLRFAARLSAFHRLMVAYSFWPVYFLPSGFRSLGVVFMAMGGVGVISAIWKLIFQ